MAHRYCGLVCVESYSSFREYKYEAGKTVLLIQHTLAYFLFLFLNKNHPRFSHTCWASSQGSPLFSPLSLILGLLSPIYEP